jgi:NTP pyrophosphatase (non-canonical NTP hydrolase)
MSKVKPKILATISGSFNKHLDKVQDKIRELQGERIEVLSPKLSSSFSREGKFVRLESDRGTPGEIESEHLKAIAGSDFLYVVNPGGYVGKSVALEIGYALSRGIPIYSLEKPEDFALSFFVKPEKSLKRIKRLFITRQNKISFSKKSFTIQDLQNYVRDMVKRRGFEKETIEDVLLLFVEEIGELARAIRDLKGLKVSDKKESVPENLREELADCLVYLLDIANLANVSLEDAFREKEKLNSARKWRSRQD